MIPTTNHLMRARIRAVRIMMDNLGIDIPRESWFSLWDSLLSDWRGQP